MTTDAAYIARMRAEAEHHREQAEVAATRDLKNWFLSRAAFFDQCAKEAEEDV